MAQRTHTCPQCSALVEVPDDYMRASIPCHSCGAILDRRRGTLFEPPPAPQEPPPQQYPPQSQYPPAHQYQHQYAPPPQYAAPYPGNAPQYAYVPQPKRGMPRWAVALVVCVVLFFGGVIGLGMWATSKFQQAVTVPPTDEWIEYRAPDGQFTAKFPREPKVVGKDVGHGIYVTGTIASIGPNAWEVSWIELGQRQTFDFDAAMDGVAQDLGGTLTKKEPRNFKGLKGMYGEIDNGRYKTQVFRSPKRVWSVTAGEHRDDFEFFLENLRLADDAIDADPFTIDFQPKAQLYEGLPPRKGSLSFRAHGGRPPYVYTVKGDLPPGLYRDSDAQSNLPLVLAGTPSTTGDYRFEVVAKDAAGRVFRAKANYIVSPYSVSQIKVEPHLTMAGSYQKAAPTDQFDTWSFECEAGMRLQFNFTVSSGVPGYRAFVAGWDSEKSSLPAWVRPGVHHVCEGVPEATGPSELTVLVNVKIEDGERVYPVPVTVKLDVKPIPEGIAPRRFEGLKQPFNHSWPVGLPLEIGVPCLPRKPAGWPAIRQWNVEPVWTYDASGLPPGLSFEEVPATGPYPGGVRVIGTPQAVGNWEFLIVCVAQVQYIEEPYEATYVGKLVITPVPEAERPAELSPPYPLWTIPAAKGNRIRSELRFETRRPGNWHRHREWVASGYWEFADIELPEGLYFEELDPYTSDFPTIVLKGSTDQTGEWEFEIKGVVAVRYVDEPYEVIQKVKLVIK